MLKEHPFLVTTTFQGDGDTIKYDATKPNRSEAVGKAYKINADGKGELVGDGEEFDGKVIAVQDNHKFTGAYMFGGLRLPLGENATVKRGDRLVGALGPSKAKGHVKALPDLSLPADLTAETGSVDLDKHNAIRTAVNSLKGEVEELAGLKGKGSVVNSDTTHALVALGA